MKKVSLFLGMVLAASFAMAQNTANVSEDGNLNTSYVKQQGSTNAAYVTQVGDLNTADVSDKYKSSLFGSLDGAKGITQEGNNNTGVIRQINGNTSVPGQAGPIAGMGQYGNTNRADITQSGSGAWFQEYAWALQLSNGNTSLQNQNSNAYSHVYQGVGDGNNAETQQLSGYDQKASIAQLGWRNYGYQKQMGYGANLEKGNVAELWQEGNDNHSWQFQLKADNKARTTQKGDNNSTYITQETKSNNANLTQNDNNNGATVLQKTGDLNIVNLTQGGGAQANIVQDGTSNTLMGLGSDIMATSLNGSILDLDQIGSGNTLHLQQTNGAHATVMQDGMTNISVVIQN